MGRAIRLVVLFLLLGILAFVVWLRMTQDGRDLAGDIFDREQVWQHGAEEKDAADKLTAMGVRIGRMAPPDSSVASVDCMDKTLGDEGYRLVGKCFRLQEASFIHCDVTDDRLHHLAGLSHLGSLVVIDAPAVTDAGIRDVKSWPELESLILKGTQVGDAGLISIAQLPKLKVLELSRTQITDAGMQTVAKLTRLQMLFLVDTQITDAGVAKLDGLPELREINVKGSKVSKEGEAHLLKMHRELKID